ncbi:MAG TPA: protein kinase [Bacteroidota bacterium]|nr:protein kinase [Bacteroidota bacterium]
MLGETISQYHIVEKLGEGGMGVVFKARDTKLDRFVALKFLPAHLAASDENKARFIQEAKAASALNHPNICTIHDIQEHGGQLFIVMEFVDGETLREKKGTLTPKQVIEYGIQIAEGLAAAHEQGVVHRDIKSENIMVTGNGRVKIMDFGVAKLREGPMLTNAGTAVGTFAYMSPEQIQGMDVDRRTDLWAFGVVLYEIATGALPFQADHQAAMMYEVLNVDPPPANTKRPDIGSNVASVITGLLQKDQSKRTSAASDVIEHLRQTPSAVPAEEEEKSIAVLYFENMSSEKESEYFCAGMTEDIITDLSKIKHLKVVSRTDMLAFRGKEINSRLIGQTLRVNYMLEGSVRKSGNKMRITAQLIDVRNGFHLWADRYDRLLEDIFDVQTEVAQKIAEALKISLTTSEKESLEKKPTDDLRAYDLYLRGKEFVFRRGKKNTEAAIQMFQNAISIDQKFSSAYSALGEACSYMYAWYDGDPKWLGKTIENNQKALDLDRDSVEASFGIGMVYYHQKHFDEAKRIWQDVIRQKPDFYDAYRWLGALSDVTGSYDEALGHYQKCAELKPYSEEPWMHTYMTHLRKHDTQSSENAMRKMIEVGERKLGVNPDDIIVLSRIVGAYAHFGEKEKAYAILKRITELDPTDGLAQYNCACTYAVLGDTKEALACLTNAIRSGYKNMKEWVKADPDLVSLRNDPEYTALVGEMR